MSKIRKLAEQRKARIEREAIINFIYEAYTEHLIDPGTMRDLRARFPRVSA